jgi:hypothetical protein
LVEELIRQPLRAAGSALAFSCSCGRSVMSET